MCDQLWTPSETPQTIAELHRIEAFKGGPDIVPHYGRRSGSFSAPREQDFYLFSNRKEYHRGINIVQYSIISGFFSS